MTEEDRIAIKAAFPEHAFLRVIKDGWQVVIAVPKKQETTEKCAAVELWHRATVKV